MDKVIEQNRKNVELDDQKPKQEHQEKSRSHRNKHNLKRQEINFPLDKAHQDQTQS